MEVESLQLLTLVLSIAHVVLVVQDTAVDPNIIRLLQTCEMMKPSSSSTPGSSSSNPSPSSASEDAQQYFPHVVFVYNRAPAHHFTPATLKKLQVYFTSRKYIHILYIHICVGKPRHKLKDYYRLL